MPKQLIVLFCFLIAGPRSAPAQDKYVDSLRAILAKKDLSDSVRFYTLFALGDRLGYSNAAQARQYLDSAYTLGAALHSPVKMGDALSGIAQAYYRTNNLDSCLILLRKADTLYSKSDPNLAKGALVSSKMNIATVLRTMGDHATAIAMYLKGVEALEKLDIPDRNNKLLTAYLNIGLVYNEFNQYDKALEYHQKGLVYAVGPAASDIRAYYLRLHRIHDWIKLSRYDSAKYYLVHEDSLYQRLAQPDVLSQLYSNWGFYYEGTKQEDMALEAFNRSYGYVLASKNEFRQVQLLSRMSEIYQHRHDYRQSASLLEKAYTLSKTLNDKPNEMNLLRSLSALYTNYLPDEHKAAKYSAQYIHLSDSLNESESRRKVNEVEAQYQVKRKADSISVLQEQGRLQALLLRRTKALSTTLVAGILLLLVIALLIFIGYKRKNRRQQQLVAMQSVLKGQEEERSRLARDLHDGVGGLLSGIKLSLASMQGNVYLSDQSALSIGKVIIQLDQSISELRRVSHNMMPEALLRYGLREALENYCANLNVSGGIKVQLHTYGLEDRLEQSTEIVLYRIVQELLNNVIRHARAQNVLLQLIRKEDRFSLTVEDDGVGFDTGEPDNRSGAGMANVRARAEYLGGTVDIHSAPGQGTSINVEGNCH